MTARPYHFAAIVGGAIAGSVAAEISADPGIPVFSALLAHEAPVKVGPNADLTDAQKILAEQI